MKQVARIGDRHSCPIHGENVIVSGGKAVIDGRAVARIGDVCACGAVIVQGSNYCADDGRPVAYLGAATSHGGRIASAADKAMVEP